MNRISVSKQLHSYEWDDKLYSINNSKEYSPIVHQNAIVDNSLNRTFDKISELSGSLQAGDNVIINNNTITKIGDKSLSIDSLLYLDGENFTDEELSFLTYGDGKHSDLKGYSMDFGGFDDDLQSINFYKDTNDNLVVYNGTIPTQKLNDVKVVYTISKLDSMDRMANLEKVFATGWEFPNSFSLRSAFIYDYKLQYIDFSNGKQQKITDLSSAFGSCYKLEEVDLSQFDLSNIQSLSQTFYYNNSITRIDLGNIDPTKITSLSNAFDQCNILTHLPFSLENLPNNTSLSYTFANCYSLENFDIYKIDISNTSNVEGAFWGCNFINEILDFSKLDFIAKNFSSTFRATNFKQIIFDQDKLLNTTSFNYAFSSMYNIESVDLSNFSFPNLMNMASTFEGCSQLKSANLSNLNVPNLITMGNLFYNCRGNLTTVNISGLYAPKLTNISNIFRDCYYLQNIDLSPLSGNKMTSISGAFHGCGDMTNIDLSPLDLSSITNISYLFSATPELQTINFGNLDWNKITNIEGIFCWTSRSPLDPIAFINNMHNVKSLKGVFAWSTIQLDFKQLNLANIEILDNCFNSYRFDDPLNQLPANLVSSKVKTISNLFQDSNISALNVSQWDMSNITHIDYAFAGTQLTTLDVSNWDLRKTRCTHHAFYNCKLTSLNTRNWHLCENPDDFTAMEDMFANSSIQTIDTELWDCFNWEYYVRNSYAPYNTNEIFNHSNLVSLIGGSTDTTKTCMKNWHFPMNLSHNTTLDRPSLLALFRGLIINDPNNPRTTDGRTKYMDGPAIITLSSELKAKLSIEDIQIALNKNWIIA